MRKTAEKINYRFLLPQLKKEPVGTQGEIAEFIPYRLEEGVTPESILRELKRLPHMASLAKALSPERKIYLLDSTSEEALLLAAEYIGTYHRLLGKDGGYYEAMEDDVEDENRDSWEDGDINLREFDFAANLPYLQTQEVEVFYCPGNMGFGFGGRAYMPNADAQRRPWWTFSLEAPIAVNIGASVSSLPGILQAMSKRSLIILLHKSFKKRDLGISNPFDLDEDDDIFGRGMTMSDLSFELETELLVLEEPEVKSVYKRNALRQLARQKGTPLARGTDPGRILHLIQESRSDVDNQTLAKAISNAVLRRKDTSPLTVKDFAYLSTAFLSKKKAPAEAKEMELVGQEEVRRQLDRIVESMAFQKRRRELGLPTDAIHYTFAFLGAPGTGKTTWAMRLAAEMGKRGLLDNPSMICINAAELKAKYVGHTTGKVKALFEQYGVIILDEAYSLADGGDEDSFGREALAQLCVELENHATDRLVVFAGYGGASNQEDNRMLRFLQSNPGINSRVSFKVHFQNFQPEELVEVFHTMMNHGGYRLSRAADQEIAGFFRSRMKERAFGNCREVRNLADRVKIQLAARLSGEQKCSRELACQVLPQDIRAAMAEIAGEYQGLAKNGGQSIGFGRERGV